MWWCWRRTWSGSPFRGARGSPTLARSISDYVNFLFLFFWRVSPFGPRIRLELFGHQATRHCFGQSLHSISKNYVSVNGFWHFIGIFVAKWGLKNYCNCFPSYYEAIIIRYFHYLDQICHYQFIYKFFVIWSHRWLFHNCSTQHVHGMKGEAVSWKYLILELEKRKKLISLKAII